METGLRAFACHASHDSDYVRQVVGFLRRHLPVFLYEDFRRNSAPFQAQINGEMASANIFLIFAGETFSQAQYLQMEVNAVLALAGTGPVRPQIVPVVLHDRALSSAAFRGVLGGYARVDARDPAGSLIAASRVAREVVGRLRTEGDQEVVWRAEDDLPYNPHLFSYEKDIIRFYARKMDLGPELYEEGPTAVEEAQRAAGRAKLVDGSPAEWPMVTDLREYDVGPRGVPPYDQLETVQTDFGQFRPDTAKVGAAALRGYETHKHGLDFPEAGPRKSLRFPLAGARGNLRVAVLVSGGIAPGINAVIDGIVQRHYKYTLQLHKSPARGPVCGVICGVKCASGHVFGPPRR